MKPVAVDVSIVLKVHGYMCNYICMSCLPVRGKTIQIVNEGWKRHEIINGITPTTKVPIWTQTIV